MATEVILDPVLGSVIHNDTNLPTRQIMAALTDQRPEIAALTRWSMNTQGVGRRRGGLFERDRYVTPDNVYDQMRLAYQAVENDDVVAGVLETTESLAFSKMSFFCEDEDEEDIWNQLAADLDLDSRLREMWRELFTVSQFYLAVWWGRKDYRVRGHTEAGVKRKKEFRSLRVPERVSLLDPLKIIPVGLTMFNREQLAWIADRREAEKINAALENPASDPILSRLILSPYEPEEEERQRLSELGVSSTTDLFLTNPATVFRHTATRPQYQHFASVRLKSVFELLDLKHQLRQMDRAHLVGGTNFIVLITQGSDQLPAKPAEIAHLKTEVKTVAQVPVLVGDHRLNVEIVTPKLDSTLRSDRYNTLDARITGRLLQLFLTGNQGGASGRDDSVKMMKVVARGMESRRQMIVRSLEANIFRPTTERNPALTSMPKLRFHPKQIALDFDANFASFLLDMRESNEISRETILSQFDLDQDDEARFRKREEERYDDIFMTQVPFSTPNPANPADPSRRETRQGGRRRGGAAPGSGQGQEPRRPRRKNDPNRQEGNE